MRRLDILRILLIVIVMSLPLKALAAAMPTLTAPPEGERWFSITMGGERVGFAHQVITRVGQEYRIDSEGSVKMKVMTTTREASSKESYLVGPDLALHSFATENHIDGSPLTTKGEVTPRGIRMAVQSGGRTKETLLKTKGAVYPPQALNIYPLMHGATGGKTYRVPMLDVESVKIKAVKVEVVGPETLPEGVATIHLRNDLYPIVDNDIWVDLKGNTVRESVRDDLIVTQAEDPKTARMHLADDVLAKKDMVLDFSLIPVQPPIDRPEQLKRLAVNIAGIPQAMPLLQGRGQEARRLPDGTVLFKMPNPVQAAAAGAPPAATEHPGSKIASDAPEIVAQKDQIVGSEKDPGKKATLLARWVAKEIKGTVTDTQSPVETLKVRNGNCQSHARLYTSMARAAGVPTRFVSGIVYAPGRGFLYHSWAESYINGWLPVDPTFGEVPANLTHIMLIEGDTADDMAALAGVIGRLRARVVEKSY
jgi:hypothetical protein